MGFTAHEVIFFFSFNSPYLPPIPSFENRALLFFIQLYLIFSVIMASEQFTPSALRIGDRLAGDTGSDRDGPE